MNRKFVTSAVAVTALFASTVGALAQKESKSVSDLGAPRMSQAQQEVKKLEDVRRLAVLQADLKSVDSMTAADYTLISPSGQVITKAQLLEMIGSGDLKFVSIDENDVHVHVSSDAAVVTGHYTAEARYKGQRIAGPYQFTRVYVKRNGRWETALQRDSYSRALEALAARP